jgi:hypothetical protein
VDLSSELKDTLSGGRFSCIYVGEDAYVPITRQVFHDISLVNFDGT